MPGDRVEVERLVVGNKERGAYVRDLAARASTKSASVSFAQREGDIGGRESVEAVNPEFMREVLCESCQGPAGSQPILLGEPNGAVYHLAEVLE